MRRYTKYLQYFTIFCSITIISCIILNPKHFKLFEQFESPDVPCLKISHWYGRMGNNVWQVKNALHVAISYGYNCIIMPEHTMFNTTKIVMNNPISDAHLKPIETDFFHTDKILPDLDYTIFDKNKQQVKRHLQQAYTVKADKVFDEDVLVIHIRSGDIFDPSPHSEYIQPPLVFYRKVIDDGNYRKIILVAEDTKNPCVNKLLELYNGRITYTPSSLTDDVKTILSAKHLVSSYGTFTSALITLSDNIKKVFNPSYNAHNIEKNPELYEIVNIDLEDYKQKLSPWTNSEEQRNIMLEYTL